MQKLDKIPTFEEFKEQYVKSGNHLEAQTQNMKSNRKETHLNSKNDDETLTGNLARKLFRSQKNFRFRKADSIDGPLYINPHLIDALEKPKQCKHLNIEKIVLKLKCKLIGSWSTMQVLYEFIQK